jgi:hypothetical protein
MTVTPMSQRSTEEARVPRKRKGLGARGLIDSELAEVETERGRLDERRNRLLSARAALDGEAVVPKARAPRVSRAQVTEYLLANPGSTYMQVADGLGIKPTTAAKHLSRGGQDGIYRYENGKWSAVGE